MDARPSSHEMILPVADLVGDVGTPALDLDVELALRLDGFRWVCWREGQSPDLPRESVGRFLARREGPLAHLQAPAPLSTPLAPQPYRHLPRYSLDPELALCACERVGLFRNGRAMLGRQEDGTWTLAQDGPAGRLHDPSLPRLLARAALCWHTRPDPRRQRLP